MAARPGLFLVRAFRDVTRSRVWSWARAGDQDRRRPPTPRAPGQHGSCSSAGTRCPAGKGTAGWWHWVRSGHPGLCPLTRGCPHSHRASLSPPPHGGELRAHQAKLARCGGAIRAWTCQRPQGRGCLQPSHLARGGTRGRGLSPSRPQPRSQLRPRGSPGARTGSAARHRGSVPALGHGRGNLGPALGPQGRAAPGVAGPVCPKYPPESPGGATACGDTPGTQSCPRSRCLPGPWGHGAPGAATGHRRGVGGVGGADLSPPPRVPPGRGSGPGGVPSGSAPPARRRGSERGRAPRPHLP